MPHPDASWDRIKQLFTAIAALPADQRAGALLAADATDDERREVLALLAAHPPTEAPTSPSDAPTSHSEGPGTRIGPYTLREPIGEGGFGTVYAAEQETPIRRRVALKIVKPGMDSRQVLARFEQERQALALMDHPNIARVFDGGSTASGRPFFVMELVQGEPITSYCDHERLTTTERLVLFADVVRAVQHAHQKGVIHRDLKPSNVLVTVVDGRPIPKVIDFGIAKATQGRLTDRTLFTEHKQTLGTPLYMSPEQAHLSGVDVDTRSDVYSLGVLLYELLTGTTPFSRDELFRAGEAEMYRVLREVEPQKPSTRIATLGATGATTAERRRVERRQLGSLLRGDLDWIVMKCLEKERARRYATAQELMLDVERHLTGEAVLAAPPSAAYRLRKFLRRHRTAGWLTAASLCIAAAGATLYGKVQETDRQALAERAFHAARQAADRGELQHALDRLENAATMGFDPIEASLARIEIHEARGEFAQANEELTALRRRSDLARHRDLVELLWLDPTRIGKDADSSTSWRNVLPTLVASADLPPTWRSYGRALLAGSLDEVFLELEAAIAEEPRNRAAAETYLWLSLLVRGPTATLPAAQQFRALWPSDHVGSTMLALCHKIRRDDTAAAAAMERVGDSKLVDLYETVSNWAIDLRNAHVDFTNALFSPNKPQIHDSVRLLHKLSTLAAPALPSRLRVHPLLDGALGQWVANAVAIGPKGKEMDLPKGTRLPALLAVQALQRSSRGDCEQAAAQLEELVSGGAEDLFVFREDLRRFYLLSLFRWAEHIAKVRPGTYSDIEYERIRQRVGRHAAQLAPFLSSMNPRELLALSEVTSAFGHRWMTREIVARAMQAPAVDDKCLVALAASLVRGSNLETAEEILSDVRSRVPNDPQLQRVEGWIKKRRSGPPGKDATVDELENPRASDRGDDAPK